MPTTLVLFPATSLSEAIILIKLKIRKSCAFQVNKTFSDKTADMKKSKRTITNFVPFKLGRFSFDHGLNV